ncbi:MAG: DMT family transporter [Flavobacteriales bacterium]
MNKKLILAHLAVFTVNLIYALNFTIAKSVMPEYIQPFPFILLRVSGALILFTFLNRFIVRQKINLKDWGRMALCGLLGVSANQLLFFEGLSYTTPINASVMMTSAPIMVFLGAVLLKQEVLSKKRFIGVLLGAIGALTIILSKENGINAPNPSLGNVLVFINAAFYSAYLILVKPLMKKYNPIQVLANCFLIGFLFTLPFSASDAMDIDVSALPKTALWAIAFVVICATCMTYLFNIYGLQNLRSSTVGFYIFLQPLLATAFAIFNGVDELTPIKMLAGGLVFVGVYLVSFTKVRVKPE